jgi:hypothetical protein
MAKRKTKEWLNRYGLATALSFPAALAAAYLSKPFANVVATAYLATLAATISFYATIAVKDVKGRKKITVPELLKVARNMIVEFGPAEYLDSFLIRPFMLYLFPLFIGNFSLAILAGNAVTDVTYFIPVIFSYEARKKLFKD